MTVQDMPAAKLVEQYGKMCCELGNPATSGGPTAIRADQLSKELLRRLKLVEATQQAGSE